LADSAAFEWVCKELEQSTSLDRLEARGTVRLTLKQAGLETRTVTPEQLAVAVRKLLPAELRARGIDEAAVCEDLARGVQSIEAPGASHESPDEVFRRLGG
jgi:hypothetical protein